MDIAATAKDTHIDLQGPYLEPQELSAVIEIASSVEGVKEVSYTEGYSPDFESEIAHEEAS